MQKTHSFTLAIFTGHHSRPYKNVFERMKELAIKVKDVKNKMPGKRPKAFFGFEVLLPANMAVAANYSSSAI
jgi:hypothetical protein